MHTKYYYGTSDISELVAQEMALRGVDVDTAILSVLELFSWVDEADD